MAHRVLSVTFEVDAQKHSAGWFNVPKSVNRLLGIQEDQPVDIEIWSPTGSWHGRRELKSGGEVYGADLQQIVEKGARIRVTVWAPVEA
jgi:hypothetical protein